MNWAEAGRSLGELAQEIARLRELESDTQALVTEIADQHRIILGEMKTENDRLKAALTQIDEVLVVNWISVKDNNYKQALHELIAFSIKAEGYFAGRS